MTDISFDPCKCGAVVVSDATAVAELKADNERLRAELKAAIWSDSEECELLTADNAKLRAALELWHLATKINVTMEGPQYAGVSFILGSQAWERTRAALGGDK